MRIPNILRFFKRNLLNLTGIILFILIGLLFLYLFFLDSEELYTSIIVGNHSGFDLNSTALTFGLITPGQSASRAFNVTNENFFKTKFVIMGKGDIFDFLTVSENDFVLYPGQSKRIIATVDIPLNTLKNTYDGKIIVSQYFSF